MSSLLQEFLMVAGLHAMAVASPGPDFALVMRQSLVAGRRAAVLSSLGIGTAILVHTGYAVLGVGVLMRHFEVLAQALRWLGTAYLLWLAFQCLRARPAIDAGSGNQASKGPPTAGWGAWRTGFLTNVLNPKATFFFIALFSSGLSPETPRLVLVGYGLWMSVATAGWFCGLSAFLTHASVRTFFQRRAHWIDRVTGVLLILFALRLALG